MAVLLNKRFVIGRLAIAVKAADLWVKTHDNFEEYPIFDLAFVQTKYTKGISFTTPWLCLLFAWNLR